MNPPRGTTEMAGSRQLLASRRHTLIFLAILFAVALAGALQTRRSKVAFSASRSHLGLYAVLIAIQLLWVRYIQTGIKAKGHRVIEFFGEPKLRGRELSRDLIFAAALLLTLQAVVASVKYLLGDVRANTGFLLPHGMAESVLWVCVSLTAGVCEEVAFRGYLQRQLAALTGSVLASVMLQAIVFGVSHGYQGWPATIVATGYGLIFGIVAWSLGNIRAGALAHAGTDIIAGFSLL